MTIAEGGGRCEVSGNLHIWLALYLNGIFPKCIFAKCSQLSIIKICDFISSYSKKSAFHPSVRPFVRLSPFFTCIVHSRNERPKGGKDEVKQARRAPNYLNF